VLPGQVSPEHLEDRDRPRPDVGPAVEGLPGAIYGHSLGGLLVADYLLDGRPLPDVAVLREVGLSVVVANATADAVNAATLQLTRTGGSGAVREFCELLLRARGEWDALVERYVQGRSEESDK